MENLNAETIKKALECCHSHSHKHCPECPYNEDTEKTCFMRLMEDALALITSQEQRIKELTEENERLRADDSELLNEFMNWLQTNEHINKSEEYRSELCKMFIETRRLNK